jgi:transcriptional regulator with XRE-family HTH domain
MSTQSHKKVGTSSIKHESREYFKVLGARISELRKECGMNQSELARAIGVSQQAVFAYELGDRRVSVLILGKLARVFEIPVEQMMGIVQTPPASQPPSRTWMHHAQRMRGLPKTAQRFIIKIIDVLEQGEQKKDRRRDLWSETEGDGRAE